MDLEEYLRSLREILAKAAVDVNCFGCGGPCWVDRDGIGQNEEQNIQNQNIPFALPLQNITTS